MFHAKLIIFQETVVVWIHGRFVQKRENNTQCLWILLTLRCTHIYELVALCSLLFFHYNESLRPWSLMGWPWLESYTLNEPASPRMHPNPRCSSGQHKMTLLLFSSRSRNLALHLLWLPYRYISSAMTKLKDIIVHLQWCWMTWSRRVSRFSHCFQVWFGACKHSWHIYTRPL